MDRVAFPSKKIKKEFHDGQRIFPSRSYNVIACVTATIHGHLEILEWLIARGFAFDSQELFALAFKKNHIHILDWLYDEKVQTIKIFDKPATRKSNRFGFLNHSTKLIKSAAEEGNLDVLKWARKRQIPWNESICAAAAKILPHKEHSSLEVLKWLREVGCPWNHQTCTNAVKFRNFETLQWARENGCEWNSNDILKSASFWSVDKAAPEDREMGYRVFEYLRSQGVELTEEVANIAIQEGDLTLLKWALVMNNCPFKDHYFYAAVVYNDLKILQWLYQYAFGGETSANLFTDEQKTKILCKCLQEATSRKIYSKFDLDELIKWLEEKSRDHKETIVLRIRNSVRDALFQKSEHDLLIDVKSILGVNDQ
jgi:hypothetical protein